MVRPYSRRRVDSGKFYRHTAERREEWVGFETSSFTTIVKEDGIVRRGTCSVCLEAKDRINLKILQMFIIQGLNSHVAPNTDSLQTMTIFLRSKVRYVKIRVLSEVYLGSHERDFSETPHRVHQYHVLKF